MEQIPRPSGHCLPLLLRSQDPSTASTSTASNTGTATQSSSSKNRQFSSHDVIHYHARVAAALGNLQMQIYRGEEAYYDETAAYGNLSKGWDGILDAKDFDEATFGSGTGSRRLPGDARWFSSSCVSIFGEEAVGSHPSKWVAKIAPLPLPKVTRTVALQSKDNEGGDKAQAMDIDNGISKEATQSSGEKSTLQTSSSTAKSTCAGIVPATAASATSDPSLASSGIKRKVSQRAGDENNVSEATTVKEEDAPPAKKVALEYKKTGADSDTPKKSPSATKDLTDTAVAELTETKTTGDSKKKGSVKKYDIKESKAASSSSSAEPAPTGSRRSAKSRVPADAFKREEKFKKEEPPPPKRRTTRSRKS